MKIKLYIIILFTSLSFCANSQSFNSKVDSLLRVSESASSKEKVLIYDELSRLYWGFIHDSSLHYAKLSLEVAEAANDKYLLGKAYNCLGNSYLDMKNPELALENYYKSIEYRRQLDNRLEVTYSLNNIALAYREMNLFSEAINSFKEAVSICQEIDDHINEAYMLIGIADVYERINDNNNALDYAIKAANIFIHYNDPIGLANTFSLIGSLHKNLNNIPLALEYYKRAHTIYTENNHEEGLSTSINHLGIVYDELGDYPRALGYFKQTLEIALANNDRVGVSTALNNIGYVNAKMKNYPEALSAYIKSVEISREMNDIPSEMNTYNNIAWVYFHSNDIIKAEYYATRAMALAPYINQLVFISESNEILSKIRYLQGRYKEAFDHKLKYMEIKDSLFNIDRNEKFMEMQVRFETTKKEKEIEILKKNDEINNLTIQRQRNFQMFWIALTFMLITLAAFIYNNLQSKKKINNLLSEKNDQLEDANKKLLESEENLKELNATKDRFFSIIAHDLKNPFNSLLGFSELLKNNFESYTKQETKEQIQIIHESANNLYKLLDNLLQWSRTQIGSIVYKPELFPLHPLVQQEIELLENFAEHKSIKIIIRVGSHLMVYADRNIIAIVIRNLINNAIKFSNVSGRILINAEEKDDMIEMAISDSGIGMEEAELKKLFRLDESFTSRGTADEEGTGLGLLLCKEFVEKNHGKIWATSTKGKGSTFYFTLHTHRWV